MQFSKTHKYSVVFIITFTILLFGIIRADEMFRIEHIVIDGVQPSEPLKGTDQLKGLFIWDIDHTTFETIQQLNPTYTIESVEKTSLSTIAISVRKQLPGAYLAIDGGYLLLSTESIVIEKNRDNPSTSYPIILYYQHIPFSAYSVGQAIDADEIQDSLYFLQLVNQTTKERVDSIDIVSYNMLGLYTGNKEYFFSSEKNRESQQWQFEQAVKQFRIDGTPYKSIDVRFDKPIVKFL
ncbi:MAG: hypothetical protein O3B87_02235 [bacterium]|nr:hypothetical protein [bacterium]